MDTFKYSVLEIEYQNRYVYIVVILILNEKNSDYVQQNCHFH